MKFRVAGLAVVLAVFVIAFSCNQKVSGASHQVTLTWTAPVVPTGATWAASGYNVYRGTSPGAYTIGTHINAGAVGVTTYTDTTVSAGQTYYYATTTWCQTCTVGQQESAFSNEIKAMIPADVVGPPNPPTALVAPTVQ